MNWGRWIILSFVAFGLFVGTLVFISVREDVNLVSRDYYADEIAYQDQIDRIENTRELSVLPSISIEGNYLKIVYPDLPRVTSGTLNLFRPSDSKLDQNFSIARTEQTSQQYQLSSITPGLYKARFTWKMRDKEYYYEKIIIL